MQVDWSIGQLMATLESAGVENETLIIVTSDNGSHWYQNDIEKFGLIPIITGAVKKLTFERVIEYHLLLVGPKN